MTSPSPDEIDRRLREAFACDPSSAERVIAQVESREVSASRRRAPSGVRLAFAAGLVLVIAAVTWQSVARRSPVPSLDHGAFVGETLILFTSDGSVSVLGPGTRDDRPPEGVGIVLVSGADQ